MAVDRRDKRTHSYEDFEGEIHYGTAISDRVQLDLGDCRHPWCDENMTFPGRIVDLRVWPGGLLVESSGAGLKIARAWCEVAARRLIVEAEGYDAGIARELSAPE